MRPERSGGTQRRGVWGGGRQGPQREPPRGWEGVPGVQASGAAGQQGCSVSEARKPQRLASARGTLLLTAPERRSMLAVVTTPEDEAQAGAGVPPEATEPSGAASCCLPSARAPSPANSTCSGFGPTRPSAPTEARTGLTRLSAQRRVSAGLARWACRSTLTACDLTEEPPTAPRTTVSSEIATAST